MSIKHICDICKLNEATNLFKVKQLKEMADITEFGVFPKNEWVNIDICTGCLIDICQAKRSECAKNNSDRIWVSQEVHERIENNPKGVIFEAVGKRPIRWKGSVTDDK